MKYIFFFSDLFSKLQVYILFCLYLAILTFFSELWEPKSELWYTESQSLILWQKQASIDFFTVFYGEFIFGLWLFSLKTILEAPESLVHTLEFY